MFQFYRPSRAQERMLLKLTAYGQPIGIYETPTLIALERQGLAQRDEHRECYGPWWPTHAGQVVCAYIERPRRGDQLRWIHDV